jgi:O-methyltransferase involved in polyketide biosynthesis
MEKDFSTISPSAAGLLLMKAFTDIPYAKAAAAFIFGQDAINQYAEKLQTNENTAWRLLHFEGRYKSVDEALQKRGVINVIEMSSGFSSRGLGLCAVENVHYIDTDLPGIVDMKKDVIAHIANPLPANYTLMPLNVIYETAFSQVAGLLPAGPLAIVNEGLLVYFNTEEKRKLGNTIHALLKERGGCWVTGDIYVRTGVEVEYEDDTRAFLEAHRVEENKFDNYEDAENLFTSCGFAVKERMIRPSKPLDGWKYIKWQNMPKEENAIRHIRETWVLVAV